MFYTLRFDWDKGRLIKMLLKCDKLLLLSYLIWTESGLNIRNKNNICSFFFFFGIFLRSEVGEIFLLSQWFLFVFSLFTVISQRSLFNFFLISFVRMIRISSEDSWCIFWAVIKAITVDLLFLEQKRAHLAYF